MAIKGLIYFAFVAMVFIYGTIVVCKMMRCIEVKLGLGERCALSLGLNVLLVTVLATILSLIGMFHIVIVCVCYALLITAGGIGMRVWKSCTTLDMNEKKCFSTLMKAECPIICILIIAGVLYLAFPTTYMWSGRDYGVYIVNAVHTAETGSSLYETDRFLNENYEEVKDFIKIGYPAFYSSYEEGISVNPGDINAQFLPMYWCLLAIGYSIGGMGGLVRISGVVSLITLGIFYYFGKRVFNKRVAVIATLLLAICPAQLWGARITQSEQLAQMLFLLAVSLFSYGWQENKKQILYLATAVLGIGSFCRMDNYILGMGIICIGIYTALWNRQRRRTMLYAVMQYVLWLIASIVYGFTVHHYYYYEHWAEKGVLKYLVLGNLGLLIVYVGVYLITQNYTCKKNPIKEICSHKLSVFVIGVGIALFLLYMYFYEFLKNGDWTTASNLQEYCWYICPLTLILAVYGIVKKCMVKNEAEFVHLEAIFLFLGIGLISTLLYTVKPSITMDHYWMSRRWVTVNFPFLILFGMHGADRIWSSERLKYNLGKILALASVIYVFIYVGDKDKLIWNTKSYEGMAQQYEELCRNIPDDVIVLTRNEASAAMLRYAYQKQVYSLREDYDINALRAYAETHDDVYYLGELTQMELLWGLQLDKIYDGELVSVAPECSWDSYPDETESYVRNVDLYHMNIGFLNQVELCDYLVLFEGSSLENGIIYMDAPGCRFYGPYCTGNHGQYALEMQFSSDIDVGEVLGTMEVVINEQVVSSVEICGGDTVEEMRFTVPDIHDVVQFRFQKSVEGRVLCKSLLLQQVIE